MATLNYLVNSSQVRSSELTDDDIKAMKAFLKMAAKDSTPHAEGRQDRCVASPEGELTLNEDLADDRAKSAMSWLKGELKAQQVQDGRR